MPSSAFSLPRALRLLCGTLEIIIVTGWTVFITLSLLSVYPPESVARVAGDVIIFSMLTLVVAQLTSLIAYGQRRWFALARAVGYLIFFAGIALAHMD